MGRVTKSIIYALIYVVIGSGLLYTQELSLEPNRWAENLGAMSDPLPIDLLIEASLYASGVTEKELPTYRARIETILNRLPAYLAENRGDSPPGELILHYLFDVVLTDYREPQTLMHIMLDTGQYNCVSSAVIYMIAARSAGLQVEGIVTPDHAFCRVSDGREEVDVETTNPYGYNPGQKREFSNAFGETGFSYVPPGNYRLRTSIGEAELIGLILQNRISLLQRRSRIDLTVPMAVDRFAMTGTERTQTEMRKEFINYASVLNGDGRYLDALSFLDQVRERWGDNPDYLQIIDTLLYNAAVVMSQEGEGEKMLEILSRREEQGDLSTENALKYRHLIGERLIFDASRSRDPLDAQRYLEELAKVGLISNAKYREYQIVLHGMQAQAISREEGDLPALRYLDSLAVDLLRDRRLRQARDVYSHNAAAAIHNQFVELYRADRLDAAEELILDGLAELPGNVILTRDLALLNQ